MEKKVLPIGHFVVDGLKEYVFWKCCFEYTEGKELIKEREPRGFLQGEGGRVEKEKVREIERSYRLARDKKLVQIH